MDKKSGLTYLRNGYNVGTRDGKLTVEIIHNICDSSLVQKPTIGSTWKQ